MAKHRRAGRCVCRGILATILCIGASSSPRAWDSPQWVRQLGTISYDLATGIATDGEGNVYISGTTEGIAGIPGDSGSLGGPNQGGFDAWVAKYSGAGKLRWKRQLGTAHDDVSYSVATDAEENLYIAGRISGYLVGERYEDNAWVAKYSQSGVLLWYKQIANIGTSFANGVASDCHGNAFISGAKFTLQDDGSSGSYDAFVAKYSEEGALLWMKQLGTAHGDFSEGVATDYEGNVYMSGYTDGSLGGANQGRSDAWVAKYSTEGALLWTRQLGTSEADGSAGIATDGEGNVYISGGTGGSLGGANQGDPSGNTYVAKYSRDGTLLWTRQLGTSTWDSLHGVATDGGGNVYISGYTNGALGGANRGQIDAWIAKYSTGGALRWKRQLGTSEADASNGVAADHDGNVYMSGYTYGALGGVHRGGADSFVAKYYTRR